MMASVICVNLTRMRSYAQRPLPELKRREEKDNGGGPYSSSQKKHFDALFPHAENESIQPFVGNIYVSLLLRPTLFTSLKSFPAAMLSHVEPHNLCQSG